MNSETITIQHVDYLQRTNIRLLPLAPGAPVTSAPTASRRLMQIEGIGVIDKRPPAGKEEARPRLPSEDLLTGLYGYKIPVAFLVHGKPDGVAIHLGSWAALGRENVTSQALDYRQEILYSALVSLFPQVKAVSAAVQLPSFPLAGLALGMPTVKRPDPMDGALAIDRLIRAMAGVNWAFLVLAEPLAESATSDLRQLVIEEMRMVQATGLAAQAPQALLDYYSELLKLSLQNLAAGLTVGAWRTGIYLLGEGTSYHRLTSLWRGIFSGDESLPEPVQVWDLPDAGSLALNWALPDLPGPSGPGSYRHPLFYQSILTSRQLAACIHLPHLETSGFAVSTVPDFDAVSPSGASQGAIALGEVQLRGQHTRTQYFINRADLARHAFIAGVTGAGKTNTVFHLLKQAAKAGVPFLVIEPAKAEYRALLNDPALPGRLRVFTLGNERLSPFRLNPFEVLPGVSVGVHLDLLRSVFAASFGMWTPLPQVLEQCLHRIYEARGWDITGNTNNRLDGGSDPSAAFPTLSDLAAQVEVVTRELGYEERIASDIHAALLTRINSLRTGGKGRMLDVRRSMPMRELLENPTVLELEGMGDDDDKAFVMGLLFIRLVEHRRTATRSSEGLEHLLVIEEAHRLLTNTNERREEEGNPRGKAVETFANLLAEIRSYGQGVIVADQVPVKLAPDVIKNTNLKIAHRVVAADDRAALAGAMAMNDRQSQTLAILPRGQAAIFSEGDDAPVIVEVALAKTNGSSAAPDDEGLARDMASALGAGAQRVLFQPLQRDIRFGISDVRAWEMARRITEDAVFQRVFSRIVLSTIEDPGALERLWPEFLAMVRARRTSEAVEADLLRCTVVYAAEWFVQHRGVQNGWTYAATARLGETLERLLLEMVDGQTNRQAREAFQRYALQLYNRTYDPYPACSKICRQQPPLCLYRHAAADLIAAGDYASSWQSARDDAGVDDEALLSVSAVAANELIEAAHDDWPAEQIELSDAASRRASLCFCQQMLMMERGLSPAQILPILNNFITGE